MMKSRVFAVSIFICTLIIIVVAFFSLQHSDFFARLHISHQTAAVSDFDSSLVGHWDFEEGTGLTTNDTGNGGNNASLVSRGTGAPQWVTGKVGYYGLLFGSPAQNYVSAGSGSSYSFIQNTGVFTIGTWVKLTDHTAAGYQTILGTNAGCSGAGFTLFYTGNGTLLFCVNNTAGTTLASATTGAGAIVDSNWHYITAVGNGSTIQLYVDGTTVGSAAAYGGSASGSSHDSLYMGNDLTGDPLYGTLDNVRIYNTALNSSQIGELYALVTDTGGVSQATGDIYIAQTLQGNNSGGPTCADAHPVSWFNSSFNWGGATGKIGPGTTVHLCGTITSTLSIQGSGSAGSPVTIHFENGAKLSSPAWGEGAQAALYGYGPLSYITVDGGANGIIENTANGTALANQINSAGVQFDFGCNTCEVKNLTVRNLYIRTPNSSDSGGGSYAVYFSAGGNHVKIHDNTLSNIGDPIMFGIPAGSFSNLEINNNTVTESSVAISVLGADPNAIMDGILIHDNNLTGPGPIWDGSWGVCSGCHNHNDGIHVGASSSSTSPSNITGLKIYNNYTHGDWGQFSTAQIFVEYDVRSPFIYNNVLVPAAGSVSAGNGLMFVKQNSTNARVYNNTFISPSVTTPAGLALDVDGQGVSVENNIFYNFAFPIFINSTVPLNAHNYVSTSDYNVFYPVSDGPAVQFGEGQIGTFAAWQVLGFDVHSAITDPLFVSNPNDLHLTSNSPAIGIGANLSPYFTTDITGVSRPSVGSAWDIG
ncbi:MAG: LamG domain-containing protein, partial [bacterium]